MKTKRGGFAGFLVAQRECLGISQTKLAASCGLSPSLFSKLEAGNIEARKLSICNAQKIAKALEVPVNVVLDRIVRDSDEPFDPFPTESLRAREPLLSFELIQTAATLNGSERFPGVVADALAVTDPVSRYDLQRALNLPYSLLMLTCRASHDLLGQDHGVVRLAAQMLRRLGAKSPEDDA